MPAMEAQREGALHSLRVVTVFATILAPAFAASFLAESPEVPIGAGTFFFGFLFARVGQQKTLLQLKRITWADCPWRHRFFGFAKWYATAPDNYDEEAEESLAVPPRPGA